MMVQPGITKLDKCVDSRYTLVVMAAKRARMLGKAMHAGLTDNNGEKPVSTAVEEIADGRVGYVRSEEIRRAREWEEEKIAAIQMLSENEETKIRLKPNRRQRIRKTAKRNKSFRKGGFDG